MSVQCSGPSPASDRSAGSGVGPVELEVSQLSKKVRRLVDEGLASQRIDPRASRVFAGGHRLRAPRLARYRAAADDILAQAFAGWSDEELQHASEIVGRIAATFQAVDSFGVRAGGADRRLSPHTPPRVVAHPVRHSRSVRPDARAIGD